jgi:class 3 adenylate cyclase
MTANRKLAAILAADVVGFSTRMQADEAGTLAALKQRRKEVLEPLVAKHRGLGESHGGRRSDRVRQCGCGRSVCG